MLNFQAVFSISYIALPHPSRCGKQRRKCSNSPLHLSQRCNFPVALFRLYRESWTASKTVQTTTFRGLCTLWPLHNSVLRTGLTSVANEFGKAIEVKTQGTAGIERTRTRMASIWALKTEVNGKEASWHVDQSVPDGISVELPKNQYDTGKMRSSLSMARDKKRRDLLSLQGQNQAKRSDPPQLLKSPKLDVLSFSSLSMLSMEVCKEVPPMADPIRIPHLRSTKIHQVSFSFSRQPEHSMAWMTWMTKCYLAFV